MPSVKPRSVAATTAAESTTTTMTATTTTTTTTTTGETKSKKAESAETALIGGYQDVPRHLWRIHGRLYDLAPFAAQHPGGADFLEVGKGRDCTELFESVHALANQNVKAILAKYEVPNAPVVPDLFSWQKGGFYDTVVQRVRKHFTDPTTGKIGNYKATPLFVTKVVLQVLCFAYCVYGAVVQACWWKALLAGVLMESLGLNVTHDGSHGAISKRPLFNRLGLWYGCWGLWDEWMWLAHHVYGHHSYTGINRRDPDMNNAKAFLRKHPEGRWKSFFQWQHLYVWPVLMLFPNQHLGQVLQYTIAAVRTRIFGVPLPNKRPRGRGWVFVLIAAMSITVNLIVPVMLHGLGTALFIAALFFAAGGSTYFFVVTPNHDSEENAIEYVRDIHANGKVIDWGEQQVRASGNHSLDLRNPLNFWITHNFGGMNFQIEHHLFPSVNNVHLPAIQPIVEQTCREFNIPYNKKATWFGGIKSYYLLLKRMGRKSSE